MQKETIDDIEALLNVLPPDIRSALDSANRKEELLEVVLDLGRLPEARFTTREITLSDREITAEDIEFVTSRISDFGDDNRAGIERTLHRISAIRNREGRIVGLTCRVGRAVYGTVDIIRDIVESGKNILLLGRPGVGKTTMLREVARILAEHKRVVVVDTSNEIAGDGDIPHPAIGRARRMQVPTPSLQHEVMIEAVENHMPEVIIIDEIGRQLEAEAARTIAERGVQLIGTAHGNTLDNLMMNPTLSDLVGGIQAVTLGDEEARRRGTQKSVLERKAPPTFDVVVEIQDWQRLAVRHDVAAAVDAILRGRALPAELRYRDDEGGIHKEEAVLQPTGEREHLTETPPVPSWEEEEGVRKFRTVRVFAYGVSQNRLRQAARSLQLPVLLVSDLGEAEVMITLRSYYRRRARVVTDAERRGTPVYVLRSNTVPQMEMCLLDVFGVDRSELNDPYVRALEEARQAIEQIAAGASSVELSPQNAYVRRQQHKMARQAQLLSRSRGKEPRRRVRIYANNSVS
jgi:stage III sporulation protein SpoIIIAA